MTAPIEALDGSEDALFQRAPRKRQNPEAVIQRAIIDRLRWLGCLVVHVPNEGKRSARGGRFAKGIGMRPGFPDLLVYRAGRHALLEVKAPTGRLSPAQTETHGELHRQGIAVHVVRSQDEALAALRADGWAL